MKSLWNDNEAKIKESDPLATRVYSSRLLGKESTLVLHGGGNTSVKANATNLFGDTEEILYVKGSGWDLSTIEVAGFAPVRLDVVKRMATLKKLSDPDMVKLLRSAMIDPAAPNPSVEAILHAIIPFKYVDHTHADAVVTITNTNEGEKRIKEIYKDRVIIVPYIMPGFILARKMYELTQNIDWNKFDGIVLMNHGVFTFNDDAKKSYENMISIVSEAEEYLKKQGASLTSDKQISSKCDLKLSSNDLIKLATLRKAVSKSRKMAMLAILNNEPEAVDFSNLPNVSSIATRGPITPDHVIRTKHIPVILGENIDEDISRFTKEYQEYFKRNINGELTSLDPAPRWAVWPGRGSVIFGRTIKDTNIASDIAQHTIRAIQSAEVLGGWKALSEKELFDMEYWVLEQAKLKKANNPAIFQGKVAIVTGAASGIGQACVKALHSHGASVVAIDINPSITSQFKEDGVFGITCDVTNKEQVQNAVNLTIRQFGGLDILISNAGTFPSNSAIEEMNQEIWQKSLEVNLHSHQLLLQFSIPYLSRGIDAAVVIIASKNVSAPGPGAAAYSVAKAGLTQLARIAALELGSASIRVNVIHPNQVFDTAIWTPEVLSQRAKRYGVSVEDYKTNNLLKTEITSKDVAELACSMAGPVFSKTTGSQVSIDGGNDRVI